MFSIVKNRLLKTGCLLLVLLVLLARQGTYLTFHHCKVDNRFSVAANDVSVSCSHCEAHGCSTEKHTQSANHNDGQQFEPSCCCEDIDADNWVSNSYTFPFEKNLLSCFAAILSPSQSIILTDVAAVPLARNGFRPAVTFRFSGRQMLTFFSQMKLDPFIL